MSKRYTLEIPWTGEASNDGAWREYDGIQTEGNTLEECLENAEVSLIDQDGGSCGFRAADSDDMQDAIVEAFGRMVRERDEAAYDRHIDQQIDEWKERKAFGEDR